MNMVDLNVCIGSSCHLKGSYNVIQTFQQLIEERKLHELVDMKAQFCMKQCNKGVAVAIGLEVFSVTPEHAASFFDAVVMPRIQQ